MRLLVLRAVRRLSAFTSKNMAARGDGSRMGQWIFLAFECGYLTEWGDGCENFSDYQARVRVKMEKLP